MGDFEEGRETDILEPPADTSGVDRGTGGGDGGRRDERPPMATESAAYNSHSSSSSDAASPTMDMVPLGRGAALDVSGPSEAHLPLISMERAAMQEVHRVSIALWFLQRV